LGIEGPKGGEIKEKVEGNRAKASQQAVDCQNFWCLGWVAMSKGFKARATSHDVGIISERVSFKLAIILAAPKLEG
jgi:hypothetical protein